VNIPILYEDNFLLVINKPPGVVVNNAESVKGETVQDWAAARIDATQSETPSEDEKAFYERAGIVHRIDKETSGCLLIAKTIPVFVELQRQFKEREVKKTYLAIVHGKLVPEEGEIRAPVGRLPWNRERFGIVPGGKEAVTKYKVIRTGNSHKTDISLVELYPETGRTHQIRVHVKYINHPIVGDWQYAGRKTARNDRVWRPRGRRHAWKVEFAHPDFAGHNLAATPPAQPAAGRLAIEAPVPDDMNSII